MNFWKKIWLSILPGNPVFVLGLGLCSTLAVTTGLESAFFMSLMVFLTLLSSSVVISALRFRIPFRFRLITFMLVISTAVIVTEQMLRAFFPEVARNLGPYVSLIVTNCIILGRLESFASGNSIKDSIIDSLGVSLGYSAVLMLMALIREFFGQGTLWGLKAGWQGFVPCSLFSSPAGAFLVFAALIALVNWLKPLIRREK